MNKGIARMREVVWKVKIRAAGNDGMTKGGTEGVQECDDSVLREGWEGRKGRN